MRTLIIGGTRFIGPYVVRRLKRAGHEVVVYHRGKTRAELPDGVEHVLGDRTELADHSAEFREYDPDVVIDMFPYTERDATDVMATFRTITRRVIAISSQDVYRAYGRLSGLEPGPPEPLPVTEDSPLRERLYPYRGKLGGYEDYDKIPVERTVMGDRDLPGTILRLPMVYGPGDGQHRLHEYLKRMEDGRPVIILGKDLAAWRWTRGYVDNIAAAITLAAVDRRAERRIYNLGEADAMSVAAWVRAIGDAAGWQGEIVTCPDEGLPAHLKPDFNTRQHLVADTTRIRDQLGYHEPAPWERALRETIAWELANPPERTDPTRFDYAAEDAFLQ